MARRQIEEAPGGVDEIGEVVQDAEASLDGLDVGAVETAVLRGYGGGRAELEGCGYPW